MTPKQLKQRRLISRWKAVAPQVHAHFGLSAPERKAALEAARRSPMHALTIYRAIAGTL